MAAATRVNNPEAMVQETLRLIEVGLKEFDQVNGRMKNITSVIILGGTGVGKSTLINLLAGVKLKAIYDQRRDKIMIDADDESLPNFKIGHGLKSETSIPRKRLIEGVIYWDSPGLEDNRSEAQEIANAVCIKEVFTVSEQVKILLMIDDDSIKAARSNPLMNFVAAVDQLFLGQVENIKRSVSLIVSQAPLRREIGHCQAYIDDVIESEELDGPRRTILESLKARISIFKEPERKSYSLDTTDVRAAIMHEISKIEYARGVTAGASVSARCHVTINNSYSQLHKNIHELVSRFNDQFCQCIDTFVLPYSNQNSSLDENQRLNAERQLKAIVEKLNAITEQEYSVQKIPGMVMACQEIAKMCNGSLTDNLATIESKVEAMRVLEKYTTKGILLPLDIVNSIKQAVAGSRIKIEKASINIAAIGAEEKAAAEKKRAEIEKQKAERESSRAEEAVQKAQRLERENCEIRHQQERYATNNPIQKSKKRGGVTINCPIV